MNFDGFMGLLLFGFVAALVFVLVTNSSGTAAVINSFGSNYTSAISAIEGK